MVGQVQRSNRVVGNCAPWVLHSVGHNRMCTPYMTECMMKFLQEIGVPLHCHSACDGIFLQLFFAVYQRNLVYVCV
jgi:hypothetical protein